jgi:hypothetical protein
MDHQRELLYAYRRALAGECQEPKAPLANYALRGLEHLPLDALANHGTPPLHGSPGIEAHWLAPEQYAAGLAASRQAAKQPWA